MKDRPPETKTYGRILAYLPVWKSVNLFDACLATSLDKLFINFKSSQIYAKLF